MGNKLTIAVVAPAGAPNLEEVDKSIALLKSKGYDVREGKHLRQVYLYYAGTVEQRSADLNWALTDPEIEVIWLARGGYGCVHCLDSLPLAKAVPAKMIVGYSDATALFQALSHFNTITIIHGPMLDGFMSTVDEESQHNIFAALERMQKTYHIPLKDWTGISEAIYGKLWGGNLTVLASLSGTQWMPVHADSIVLLEDVGEVGYRLDRSLTQLIYNGAFTGVRAIVLGELTNCTLPSAFKLSIEAYLVNILRPLNIPLFSGFPMGHEKRNLSWQWGVEAKLEKESISYSL